MKRKVNNGEVYHLFANQSQSDARSNNRSFNGTTAYSYGMTIARLVENSRGSKAFLVVPPSRSSVTTNRAIGEMYGAIGGRTRFTVDSDVMRLMHDAPRPSDYEFAVTIMIAELESNIASLKRKRDDWRISHGLATCRALQQNIIDFCQFFDIAIPGKITDMTYSNMITDAGTRKEKTPAQLRAAERAKAKREAVKAEEDRLASLAYAHHTQAWINGETDVVPYKAYDFRSNLPRYAYMRLKGDNVQTTMGAVVPASHVKRIAPLILRSVDHAMQYQEVYIPPVTVRLGHYILNRIDANGDVHVGCHTFSAEEIKRFATVIAGYEEKPSSPSPDALAEAEYMSIPATV